MVTFANDRRAVITGLGTINPIGTGVPQFWDNLIAGKSGGRRVQNVDLGDYHIQIAAEVDLPDVTPYFREKRLARRIDRFAIFAQIAAHEALTHSGLPVERAPDRIGAIIGTGDAGLGKQEEAIERMLARGMDRVPAYYVSSHIPSTASALVALEEGLMGPNFTVNSACASSNHAIGIATALIRAGMVDAVLAGGAEAVATRMSLAGFGNIHALSDRNDEPATASRPFDRDRDGFLMGEGSGIVVVEALDHARARGAEIYAEVSGFGFSCDAHDLVAPHPEGLGAQQAMRQALEVAKLNRDQIGLINAHGTSTVTGDLTEARAIHAFLGSHAKHVMVHSTKSMTGHLIGAAGGTELVASALAFSRNLVHPTINQFNTDPEIELDVVPNEVREARVDHILCNSFGFGGQNAVLIVSRFKG